MNERGMVLKGGRRLCSSPWVSGQPWGGFGSAPCHCSAAPVAVLTASWSAGKGWHGEKCQDEYCIGSLCCQHHVCEVPP